MAEPTDRRRTLMGGRPIVVAPEFGAYTMDLVYIAAGAAMFALFAVYAVLLRRV